MNPSRRAPLRSSLSRKALLMGTCLLGMLGALPAQAQYFSEPEAILPPRAVVWRLNDRGFTEITRPRFDGRAYVVEASGPYGNRLRLFVDARDGAILGRERLDRPVPRIVRPAPGYGWTEEDEGVRRPIREAERIVPPADIPSVPEMLPRRPRLDPSPVTRSEAPDGNPLGMNPDGRNPDTRNPESRGRVEAPRKVVRLTPPKATAPRPATESPKLADTPPTPAAKPATAPASAALEAPKAVPVPVTPAPTPAAVQPPPPEKAASKDWKDPPADQKRNVRVIGGATIVPGANPKDEPAKE